MYICAIYMNLLVYIGSNYAHIMPIVLVRSFFLWWFQVLIANSLHVLFFFFLCTAGPKNILRKGNWTFETGLLSPSPARSAGSLEIAALFDMQKSRETRIRIQSKMRNSSDTDNICAYLCYYTIIYVWFLWMRFCRLVFKIYMYIYCICKVFADRGRRCLLAPVARLQVGSEWASYSAHSQKRTY